MTDLNFEAPVGTRFHRYFIWVNIDTDDNLWWNTTKRVWEPMTEEYDYSNCAPCKTLKAFKRMLRKHPNIVGKAVLVNRYVGHDVYSVGVK